MVVHNCANINSIKLRHNIKIIRILCHVAIAKVRYHLVKVPCFRCYWEQMLEAVQQVHENNIIHADLKPANFLLVAGLFKVIDFGLAIEMIPGQDYVSQKSVGGTKEYMSPETMAGYVFEDGVINKEESLKSGNVRVSTKSDVWALGIILYQAVYCELPFASVPGGKIAKMKALSDPDIPVEFPTTTNLDPLLFDTMKKCLNKDPEQRATIAELLQHPYLRPNHDAPSIPVARTCNVCRTRERKMSRLTTKRLNAFNRIN